MRRIGGLQVDGLFKSLEHIRKAVLLFVSPPEQRVGFGSSVTVFDRCEKRLRGYRVALAAELSESEVVVDCGRIWVFCLDREKYFFCRLVVFELCCETA